VRTSPIRARFVRADLGARLQSRRLAGLVRAPRLSRRRAEDVERDVLVAADARDDRVFIRLGYMYHIFVHACVLLTCRVERT
jgi:hypothetical protein